jgi:UDP-glucose 4-epimerase
MKIIVTGGAGFIGSAIIPRLQEKNHDVYVIDDLSFGNRNFIKINDTHFFEENILNSIEIKRIIKEIRPEIVIHLAAVHFIPYCNQHPFESANINIQGTINILEACKEINSIKKILFASTAAVYPIYDHAVKETDSIGPLDIYGLSKLAGEHLMNGFHKETGISTIICRFFNAFGPNETNPHLIPEIEKQLREGNRNIKLGNTLPKRDFIHTSDMASAMIALLGIENLTLETFNLGRGIEYSVTEVVSAFSKILGEDVIIEQDPSRMRKSERMHLLSDISKLKEWTSWEPKWTLEEGIQNLVNNW